MGLRVDPVIDLAAEPAQEPVEPPINFLRAVVPATERLTKRVFLVIDVSGSMRGDPLGKALRATACLLSSPVDDFEVAIIAFNDQAHRWPGVPEPDDYRPVPPGWARLPSAEALESANAWLAGFSGSGSTRPCDALAEALREQRKDMSVLLVTDGLFDGGQDESVSVFEEGQTRRARGSVGRAVFVVYGVGQDTAGRAHLAHFGREGGGGFFVDSNQKPKVFR